MRPSVRPLIVAILLLAGSWPSALRADDTGGLAMGPGFGVAQVSGDLGRRFQARSVAVRVRSGLQHDWIGAELDMAVVLLNERGGGDNDTWTATLWGPSLAYYYRYRPIDLYLRGGVRVGHIVGPTRTETVPCTPPEDCVTREQTVTPRHPTFGLELAAGAQVHLARKRSGAHPVLWVDYSVRALRSSIDGQVMGGYMRQLAVGLAYGRGF